MSFYFVFYLYNNKKHIVYKSLYKKSYKQK